MSDCHYPVVLLAEAPTHMSAFPSNTNQLSALFPKHFVNFAYLLRWMYLGPRSAIPHSEPWQRWWLLNILRIYRVYRFNRSRPLCAYVSPKNKYCKLLRPSDTLYICTCHTSPAICTSNVLLSCNKNNLNLYYTTAIYHRPCNLSISYGAISL